MPADLRVRLLRYYVLTNTLSLVGDWRLDKSDLWHRRQPGLLSVNKLTRGEALPLAHPILVVLPQH